METLKEQYTIVIVTIICSKRRVSDFTAFIMINENGAGNLVEVGPTEQIFTKPKKPTEEYVTGRFG